MNDPESSQEFTDHVIGVTDQYQTVGQSFLSHRERLNGIMLWVTTVPDADVPLVNGTLVVKLFYSNQDSQPIHATNLPISPSWINSQIEISVPPQLNPPGQQYYIQIESTGTPVQVHGRNENAYVNGSAYMNGYATTGDLAFRLSYDYDVSAVMQDLRGLGARAGLLVPLGLTIFLPGWVLLDLTGQRRRFDFGEQSALAVGLSLATIPLLMLWSTVFHVKWSRAGILWALGFLAGIYIFRFVVTRLRTNKINNQALKRFNHNTQKTNILYGLALLTIITSGFFVRMAMVRDLVTPAWVDSVHHATITRLILGNGNFPTSYEPFMKFDVYNYHVGFHSGLAVFTWLSGLEIPDAMLFYGQALNALAALAVYLLTTTITRKPVSGLFAAFIASFLTPMPAYYTSWGRYTQLAGLLILPPIITLLQPVLHKDTSSTTNLQSKINAVILAIIAISGLFLIHYRVIAFAIFLLVADFVVSILTNHREISSTVKRWSITGMICIIGSILFASPWFFPTLSQIFIPKLTPLESGQATLFGDFTWRFLTTAYGKQALTLAGFGLCVGLFKRPRSSTTVIIWTVLLLFFANLDALKLPGGGFITGTSVVIMFFIPISLLGGDFLEELTSVWQSIIVQKRNALLQRTNWLITIIIFAVAASFGARQLLPIINPITILSRQADRNALNWINQNLPKESTFIINSFSWGFGLYAGNDGGYWISPVTGALTIPPPALYGLGEKDTVDQINEYSQLTANKNTSPQKIHEAMLSLNIDYLYIGARGGAVSVSELINSDLYEQIYNQNGTWIFIAKPAP